ncbi:MAG TPA: hypothetical protein VN025_00850 [Candidatus Dormibacteraeota bacterium]|jgi:hypothetical protein|nr:hypothetical protein [Candidatus Dormibacteraeota bacterium]
MKLNFTKPMHAALAVALLAASAALWGCAQAGSVPVGGGNPPPAAALMDLCNNTANGCSTGNSFSLNVARDINIKVSWINVAPGTHTQTMQIIEPGGGLYEAKTQAFAIADGSAGSVNTEEIFPVAGTWITERQRTGEWTIQISLDDQLYTTQKVQLTP